MASIFSVIGRVNQYASVRVHGTSAQVQFTQPDDVGTAVTITRLPEGTQIEGHHTVDASIHLSIPTPVFRERPSGILSVLPGFPEVIFSETSIRVERVEVYTQSKFMAPTNFRLMDGNRTLRHKPAFTGVLRDEYFEEYFGSGDFTSFNIEVNQRIYYALGVSFDAPFRSGTSLLVFAARAIFLS